MTPARQIRSFDGDEGTACRCRESSFSSEHSAAAPPTRPRGRPSALRPELIAEVRRLLPVVLHLETVADLLGVHRSTLFRWQRRGEREARRLAKGYRPKRWEALYFDFCNAYKKGLAEAEMFAIGIIRAAAAGTLPAKTRTIKKTDRQGNTTEIEEIEYVRPQWTAAAWLLERRWPERWSLKRRVIRELHRNLRELRRQVSAAERMLLADKSGSPR